MGRWCLSSLSITSSELSENGVVVPSTNAATVRFHSADKPNRASGNGDVYDSPRLAQIENGYGGRSRLHRITKLTVEITLPGITFRVKKADVESGLGKAASREYTCLRSAL